MANFGVFLRLALLCSVILRYSFPIYEHHAYHQIFCEENIPFSFVCSMISARNQNLTCHHWNICVTASCFSQTHARPVHFLIETADETAVDEPASLNRQGPSNKANDKCAGVCKADNYIDRTICEGCKIMAWRAPCGAYKNWMFVLVLFKQSDQINASSPSSLVPLLLV